MDTRQQHVIAFYARHPISAAHILKALEARRGHLRDLQPEELWAHDQDHYGGLAANDALAEAAGFRAGQKVADFCAGLGGPARYFAARYDVDVTGVELTRERVEGADVLTRAVSLQDRVRVVSGDVTAAPLGDCTMDAVFSQEAFLHIPDKAKAVDEAARILKPGGTLAFTDWVRHRTLDDDEAQSMWTGIAAQTLQSIADYEDMLAKAGLEVVKVDDLTTEWGTILAERSRMYQQLREDARKAGTPEGDDAFYNAYMKLVELVQTRALGGARFTARKPA